MTLRSAEGETRYAGVLLAAALVGAMVAGEIIVPLFWSAPAFAGSNAGGNGNSGGNGNAGGNSGAKSNAGGNGKGHGAGSNAAAPEVETPNAALGLLESGKIRSLAEVYRVAERQFGGEVIDAELVADDRQGWAYDLRIVTEDGYVRNASYNASTLALMSLNGEPVE